MNDQPVRVIRPVVVPAQFAVTGPLVAGFAGIFPGFFVLVISNIVAGIAGRDPFQGPLVMPGVVAFGIGFAVVLWIGYLRAFVEPLKTSYAIYADRLEYDEGFLNKHRRTLLFDRVIDVHLVEGVRQQTRSAGTITLTTQQMVSSGDGKLSNRTVALSNVPEPREVYELLRSLSRGRASQVPE